MTADAWFGLPEIPAISDLSLKDAPDQLSVSVDSDQWEKIEGCGAASISGQCQWSVPSGENRNLICRTDQMTADAWFGLHEIPAISDLSLKGRP
jgi:hypothetical protein